MTTVQKLTFVFGLMCMVHYAAGTNSENPAFKILVLVFGCIMVFNGLPSKEKVEKERPVEGSASEADLNSK